MQQDSEVIAPSYQSLCSPAIVASGIGSLNRSMLPSPGLAKWTVISSHCYIIILATTCDGVWAICSMAATTFPAPGRHSKPDTEGQNLLFKRTRSISLKYINKPTLVHDTLASNTRLIFT